MKLKIALTMLLGMSAALTACQNQDDKDRLNERSKIEQEGALQAQTANLEKRVGEMENDLNARHFFYESVKGVYEGKVQASDAEYNIRMTFTPSLPPIARGRTRTMAEVEYDLNNLSFNVQVVQWKPNLPTAAVGCRVQGVRPDLSSQEMTISSQECPNLYHIVFRGNSVDGVIQPTTNAHVYSFQALKQEDALRRKHD